MNPDDKEETKMKTKMKVAVCTLLCMTMACAAANAEGGTTNSMNSGRPQTRRKNKIQSGGVGYKYSHQSARKLPRVSSNHQRG